MPLGLTFDFQTVTEVGATSDQNITLSGTLTCDNQVTIKEPTAGLSTPSLIVDKDSSAGLGKVASFQLDGTEFLFAGATISPFTGLIGDPTGIIFFATSVNEGFLLNGVAPSVVWGTNMDLASSLGSTNLTLEVTKTDFKKPIELNLNQIILDADGDTYIQAPLDDVVIFVANSAVPLGFDATNMALLGATSYSHITASGTATIAVDKHFYKVNTTTVAANLTIPAGIHNQGLLGNGGKEIVFQDTTGNAAVNNITLIPGVGAGTINGAANYVINANYGRADVWSDGTNLYAR